MSKEAFYFSHDSNARNDEKLISLRMKHKWDGYGIYWALIEKLRDSSSYKLPLDYNVIAFDLRTDNAIIKSVINDFGLFVIENNYFYSESLCRRMEMRTEKARTAANKRWENANALQTHNGRNANGMLKDANKGKESKVNEIKEKKGNKVFVPPELLEVESYFEENGYTPESAKKAFKYYSTAEWHDSKGNKVKNWKQKMQAVWFKEENLKEKSSGQKENKSKSEILIDANQRAHDILAKQYGNNAG